jgi:molybdopterin-guanine dinucleotide biosynthesis protein A
MSRRMGRDKSRLRLGRRTLLGHIRAAALALGGRFRVRVIRHDKVPCLGPLGGMATALHTTRADAVMFLACDMPLITPGLLRHFWRQLTPRYDAVLAFHKLDKSRRLGFPAILRRQCLPGVLSQLLDGERSVQSLFRRFRTRPVKPRREHAGQLMNVNTPQDWEAMLARWRARSAGI